MNFVDIVKKYNYDPSLAEFLEQIYKEFINYFGEGQRKIIYEAFLNCPVLNVSNCYDALNNLGFLDNVCENQIVTFGDLKRATGVYSSKPDINFDVDSNSYNIIGIRRVVAISNLDLDKEYIRAALIYELAHLVKSYYGEYEIVGNILIERSGLIEKRYLLSQDKSNVKLSEISVKGIGLEEGLTSMVEEDISKKIINPDYKVNGYGVVNTVARQFTSDPEDLIKIIMAQIYEDKTEILKLYPDDYYTLESVVDKIYEYSLKMFALMFDTDKMKEATEELNKYLEQIYVPLMKKMKDARGGRK